MIVALQAQPKIAGRLLRMTPGDEPIERIRSLLARFNVALQPTFPQVDDPELRTHFYVEVADPQAAETLASSLAQDPDIEAAYVKPREAAP